MNENNAETQEFLGKVMIKGRMEVITGLHIGASKETVKIGGIDSPVVRDPVTNLPYIPGSSLKGKMRSLMEKALGKEFREISKQPPIQIHVCGDEHCEVCRLFGSSVKVGREQKHIPARLIVRDLHLLNRDALEKIDTGLPYTEWKFENSIDRVTSAANPRQIERVPAGAVFGLELVYDAHDRGQLKEDIENIHRALKLLENDALGGHGSRGYGQVRFSETTFDVYPTAYYACGDETHVLEGTKDMDAIVSALIDGNNEKKS
ncbi:MAG: type III-A CRISPR-associated RAMP protein Csm3 [Candidatus Methanospirareceae archaeon]